MKGLCSLWWPGQGLGQSVSCLGLLPAWRWWLLPVRMWIRSSASRYGITRSQQINKSVGTCCALLLAMSLVAQYSHVHGCCSTLHTDLPCIMWNCGSSLYYQDIVRLTHAACCWSEWVYSQWLMTIQICFEPFLKILATHQALIQWTITSCNFLGTETLLWA